jgi:hypothetical protein
LKISHDTSLTVMFNCGRRFFHYRRVLPFS